MTTYNLAEYGFDEGDDELEGGSGEDECNAHDNDDDAMSIDTSYTVVMDLPTVYVEQYPSRLHWLVAYATMLTQVMAQYSNDVIISRMPFPIAAFGTLRVYLQNNHYMGLPGDSASSLHDVGRLERDQLRQTTEVKGKGAKYSYWSPIHVPHTACEGLYLTFSPHVGCKAELFAYEPQEFSKVIDHIDNLENYRVCRRSSLYNRTLLWCHVLPWGMHDEMTVDLTDRRCWSLTPQEVHHWPRVPVWTYSRVSVNALLLKEFPETVLWHDRIGIN
jgi:hypothetical protein